MIRLIRGLAFFIATLTTLPVFAQEEISAPGPMGALGGTWLQAKTERAPVVLLIPGSGPVDRDGNIPKVYEPALLRRTAQALELRGISTLRADKRGMYGSVKAVESANAVTIADYAADARQWIQVVRQRTGLPCVWILGHSEGGLVALMAAQQPQDICGLVLAGTPGRRLGTVLREQLKANPANGPILDNALSTTDALEAGRHVEASAIDPRLMPLFRPAVQDYLIDTMALDPVQLISRYKGPVLILQGEKDVQVKVADAKLLRAANVASELVLLPDLDHNLRPTGASKEQAAEPEAFTTRIADFVASHSIR